MGRQRHLGTTVVLLCDRTEVASWPLRGSCRPDLALVDHLAQVQLAARRLGCAIELRHAGPELAALVDLVGLSDVLGRQVVGQAEGGEEGGVEEAVPGADPPA
ncbi:MAG: STAS domain-containing protein [Acidimicrobiia bacterium]